MEVVEDPNYNKQSCAHKKSPIASERLFQHQNRKHETAEHCDATDERDMPNMPLTLTGLIY